VKLLEVPVETIEQALSQMLTNGLLLLEEIEGEPLIFLPHLRKAEDGIATKVKWLATAGVTYPKIDFEKAVAWCEKKTGKILAPSQRQAMKTTLTSRLAIITGGPGVGICVPHYAVSVYEICTCGRMHTCVTLRAAFD
jgi:exodeoxyribonuclease V alpha subunit